MTKFEEELMATAKMIPTSDGNEIKFKTSSALYDYLLLSNGEAELYLESQLQQQALPVVKDFVAEWYEEHKADLDFSIFEVCVSLYDDNSSDFKKWFGNSENKSIETLVRMKNGYQVEKSDKCMVKLGALYFKCWNDVDAVFIIDDQPGAYESAFVFKKREDAEKVAQLVGGRVVKS